MRECKSVLVDAARATHIEAYQLIFSKCKFYFVHGCLTSANENGFQDEKLNASLDKDKQGADQWAP